jgi:hypothetical protein
MPPGAAGRVEGRLADGLAQGVLADDRDFRPGGERVDDDLARGCREARRDESDPHGRHRLILRIEAPHGVASGLGLVE